MERVALLGSSFFYFFSCCSTLLASRTGSFRPGRFHFMAIALGVLCQSWFLVLRGGAERACPIGTFPETLIFLSWAIGLFYIVIGSAYRISLMGLFTAPLIFILQSIALLLPQGKIPLITISHHPWVETHAALSLVSFGAFGLACVAGLMFLLQEKQLKSQRPSPIFHHLPPIRLLEKVTFRLLLVGFFLLTISFIAGFIAGHAISGVKVWIALLVWGGYFITLAAHRSHHLSAHRLALLAVGIFIIALLLLPGVRYFSHIAL